MSFCEKKFFDFFGHFLRRNFGNFLLKSQFFHFLSHQNGKGSPLPPPNHLTGLKNFLLFKPLQFLEFQNFFWTKQNLTSCSTKYTNQKLPLFRPQNPFFGSKTANYRPIGGRYGKSKRIFKK